MGHTAYDVAPRDYGALIEKLEACRNRDFTETASKNITSFLLSVGWDNARSLVKNLCRRDTIPTNVLGALEADWEVRKSPSTAVPGDVFNHPRVPPGFFEEELDGVCDRCGAPTNRRREKASSYPGKYWTFYTCTKCGYHCVDLPKPIPLVPGSGGGSSSA